MTNRCVCCTFVVALVVLCLCLSIPLANKRVATQLGDQAPWTDSFCQVSSYPSVCNQTLGAGVVGNNFRNATSVTKLAFDAALTGVEDTRHEVLAFGYSAPDLHPAVEICLETLGFSQNYTAAASRKLQGFNVSTRDEDMETIKAWMSAAMEFHTTCVDVVSEELVCGIHTDMLFSNALAIVNALATYGEDVTTWKRTVYSFFEGERVHGGGNRKLLSEELKGGPVWTDLGMQEEDSWYDVVVAKDGSGSFDTIQAAVDAHANNLESRLVVYVKAGFYEEQVNVPSTCKFLSIVGDGDSTVITGDKNVATMPGMTTYNSATLIVAGEGFFGKNFKVQNTAGSAGYQAVAYRGSADELAFHQVTFDGHQDTLYAHAGRQFFRDCTILGTVDFIFGNGAAVLQSCTIIAKATTILGQQNTYTAQGRTDPHQSTGFSFQHCKFVGTQEVISNPALYPTYLGRPWNPYSVSVIMKSNLPGHIDPTGWLPWNSSSYGLYTSFLAEYHNFGEGAAVAARVNWSHQIDHASEAAKYSANSFVQAKEWVRALDVPLTEDF